MSLHRRDVGGRLVILILMDKLEIFCVLSLILLLGVGSSTPVKAKSIPEIVEGPSDENAITELQRYKILTPTYVEELESRSDEQDQNLLFKVRMIRSGNGSSSKNYKNAAGIIKHNQLSRALERMHFGPLLRLTRPISSRAIPKKSTTSSLLPLYHPPTEKKALSFFSRFYPVLQHSSVGGSAGGSGRGLVGGSDLMNIYTPRRRISYPHSGEHVFPVNTRFTRPIMRLRWGK